MIRPSLRTVLVLFFALTAARDLPAETTDSLRVERLTRLGRLWGAVRYLHPSLAYRELDWDAALFAAVPRVRATETPEQFADAVRGMLDALGDPATRVQPQPIRRKMRREVPGTLPRFQWIDGLLAVDLRAWDFDTQEEMDKALQALRAEIPRAQAIIIDARGRGEPIHSIYFVEEIQDLLVGRPARTPAQRSVFHSGYRTQIGLSSGGYYSGFLTLQGEELTPGQDAVPLVVFVTDASTLHAPLAAALQATGDGLIVSEGPFLGDGFTQHTTVDVGEDFQAVVRTTETLPLPGWPGPHADLEVSPAGPDGPDTALEAALRLARKEIQPQASPTDAPPLPEAVWRPDKIYPGEPFPPLEHRLLAVYRIWNIIDLFYPYKHLIGDWNSALPEFVARMEATRDGREYVVALGRNGGAYPGYTHHDQRPPRAYEDLRHDSSAGGDPLDREFLGADRPTRSP